MLGFAVHLVFLGWKSNKIDLGRSDTADPSEEFTALLSRGEDKPPPPMPQIAIQT